MLALLLPTKEDLDWGIYKNAFMFVDKIFFLGGAILLHIPVLFQVFTG